MVAGSITTQPKQGRQAAPMSSLCILLCLWTKISTTCLGQTLGNKIQIGLTRVNLKLVWAKVFNFKLVCFALSVIVLHRQARPHLELIGHVSLSMSMEFVLSKA